MGYEAAGGRNSIQLPIKLRIAYRIIQSLIQIFLDFQIWQLHALLIWWLLAFGPLRLYLFFDVIVKIARQRIRELLMIRVNHRILLNSIKSGISGRIFARSFEYLIIPPHRRQLSHIRRRILHCFYYGLRSFVVFWQFSLGRLHTIVDTLLRIIRPKIPV